MQIVFVAGVVLFLLAGAWLLFQHRRDRRAQLKSLERWAERDVRRADMNDAAREPLPWEHPHRAGDGTPRA